MAPLLIDAVYSLQETMGTIQASVTEGSTQIRAVLDRVVVSLDHGDRIVQRCADLESHRIARLAMVVLETATSQSQLVVQVWAALR